MSKRYVSKISGKDYTSQQSLADQVFWATVAVGMIAAILVLLTKSMIVFGVAILCLLVSGASFTHLFWMTAFCKWSNQDER